MKTGDIVFVRGKSPISRFVKWFDGGPFSHVAIAVSSTHILEAQYYTRSRITPFRFQDYEILDLGLTEEQRDQVQKLSIQLVGKWYDYSQIIGYVISRFFRKSRRNLFNSPNNLICSELIQVILQEIGWNHVDIPKDVTPNQLYLLLEKAIKEKNQG